MTIETTINNGLPVEASGRVVRADATVGPPGWVVEDLEITFLSGYPIPFELSDEDDQRVVNELVAAYNEPPCDC